MAIVTEHDITVFGNVIGHIVRKNAFKGDGANLGHLVILG